VQTKGKNNTLTYIVHLLIYKNVHHIVCHTMDIKSKLLSRYGIAAEKISVTQRGVNSLAPITTLSQYEARRRLNIEPRSRVLLLFGRIQPVKGYEPVLQALDYLLPSIQPVTLLIAGNAAKQTNQNYLKELRQYVREKNFEKVVQFHPYHIPEDNIELFFKASGVTLLPYVEGDFQSGVLFLALRFGVPVIASDISLLPETIAQGVWGYVFDAGNPRDLAAKIVQFYRDLQPRCGLRQSIQEYGRKQYSWEATAMATVDVYHRVASIMGSATFGHPRQLAHVLTRREIQ
jgi:glycosyltransferase involved in cell wall biosynthesis